MKIRFHAPGIVHRFLLGIAFFWLVAAAAAAPSISWTTADGPGSNPFGGQINPSSVASGETYLIRAQGVDASGNLAAVSINKNGQPFAYAGGGDGTSYISNNPSSDAGPGTITYTAWATDSSGQTSDTISWTVTLRPPPPSISWTTAEGPGSNPFGGQINPTSVAAGEAYMIRAQGVDASGNLATVNINKNGQPFAYAGGGDGTSYISNNPSADGGPATVTYNAWATDTSGQSSDTISWNVQVGNSQSVSANISASPSAGTWPLSPTISWNSSAATAVSVSGPGLSSSATSGSQTIQNLSPGSYTYTITAEGAGGPASGNVTVTVASPLAGGLPYARHKYVGIFYLSWFGSGYAWDSAWGGVGVSPTIGRYVSDAGTGAAHAQRLKQLGVDFMAIDSTNNTTWGPNNPQIQTDPIFDGAEAVISGFGGTGMKAAILLSISNSRGGTGPDAGQEQLLVENYDNANPPYMYYPDIPSNAGDLFLAKVARVYNELATDPTKYFYYDGKPLLLLYTTASGAVFDVNGTNRTPNGKLDDTWNPPVPAAGNAHIRDLFTIRWVGAFIANSGNPAYVDTSGDQTIAKNGNWSWEDTYPQAWAKQATGWQNDVFPESLTVTAFSRAYGSNAVAGRNNGVTFANQWSRAYEVDPLFTMVHTWNEFSTSGDEPSVEFSQSLESNNQYGASYETQLGNYASFFKSLRLDVGLYDVTSRLFDLYNRKDDFGAPASTNFGFATSVTMDRGSNVQALSGDFNKDGLFDIGLRNADDGTIAIRYSPRYVVTGAGDSPGELVVTLDAGSDWQVFTGDFNRDGFCDLGLYNRTSKLFKFYINNGAGGFNAGPQFAWDVGGNVQITSADINGDGRADLIVRDPSSGVITFGLDNGDGLSSVPNRIYSATWASGAQYQLFAGDFSGDGMAEIGLRDGSIGRFYFLQNLRGVSGSTWNFGSQTTYDGPAGSQFLPIAGDFR